MFENECHYGEGWRKGWLLIIRDYNTGLDVRECWCIFRSVFWTKWWCCILKTWPRRSLSKASCSHGRFGSCSVVSGGNGQFDPRDEMQPHLLLKQPLSFSWSKYLLEQGQRLSTGFWDALAGFCASFRTGTHSRWSCSSVLSREGLPLKLWLHDSF